MVNELKNIIEAEKINLELEQLTKQEHGLQKELEQLQESISIKPNEIEELYTNISKMYSKIQDLDDYYKNKKGFHFHLAQESKILNLDDLNQVKSLEELKIIYPFGTTLLKNSIVCSSLWKEQYYATPSVLDKDRRELFFYFPMGMFTSVAVLCIPVGPEGINAAGACMVAGSVMSTTLILADLFRNKNSFEYTANQMKINTIEASKLINQYLSSPINPEEYFKK